MSLPRPSGLKQPSKIGRPSGLPTARPQTPVGGNTTNTSHTQNSTSAVPPAKSLSAIAKSARGVGFCPEHADHYADDVSRILKAPELLDDNVNADDFKIGDRVWVSGNKPGIIAFIGEAQFAPGEWAGIVLDEPVGKNDGSVMGVRYFQCEAKRGVFSRLNKLSHTHQQPSRPSSQGHDSNSSESKQSDYRPVAPPPSATNGLSVNTSSTPSRPLSQIGLSSSKTLPTSSSSINKASSAGTTPTGTGDAGGLTAAMRQMSGMNGGVKLGDRVLVSGSKPGILRFIGETDFAKGMWAGVELDEPLGKNDGAVAGKKYFECKPLHGLFAPVHKISPVESASSTPSPHSRPIMSTSLRSSRERSGSQESVSSLSSTASSVSRSRVRLGVTSLANQTSKSGQRPSTLNLSATTAALQKALKEKEEHIEQLLRERDLERSEVARAAAHVDEAEGQLSIMKTEQSRLRLDADEQMTKYRALVSDLENEKQELLAFLEEEKRKVEDLQFQLEEETLKDDMDNKMNTSANELQVKELERQIKKEKERADGLERDLSHVKQKFENQQKSTSEAKAANARSADQMEELTHKLAQAESKIRAFESTRMEDGAKTSKTNMELAEKQRQVKELEDQLSKQRREMTSLSQQLNDLRDELNASNEKRKKQDEHIKELTTKLKQIEDERRDVMDEIRNANTNNADLQRQLTASKTKAEELVADRAILESRLSELAKNSGDSSSQLAALSDQLTERNRKLEDLQNDLLNYSQNLAKSEEKFKELRQEKDREIQDISRNFQDKIVKLEDDIKDLNLAIDKTKSKASQASEQYESEKKEALDSKDAEIRELKQQLTQVSDELTNQQDRITAHRQMLEKVNSEKEALQYDKLQAEKQLKRVEEEKCSINTELIQARVEAIRNNEGVEGLKKLKLELEDKVDKLSLQVACMTADKEEADKSKDEAKSQKLELIQENKSLKQDLASLKGEMQKREVLLNDMKLGKDKLQTELSRKAEEFMHKSQTESEQLAQELNTLSTELEGSKSQMRSKDAQVEELQAQVKQYQALAQDKDLLEKERLELIRERTATEEKCRSFIKEVEDQSQKAAELHSKLESSRSCEQVLRQEKQSLQGRVSQLEKELETVKQTAEQKGTVSSGVPPSDEAAEAGSRVYSHLKEEAEFATKQVEFLNSVIVELQNKNQDLQHRLSVMEDSGIHTNGEFTEVLETPSRSSRAPPRLFCDICDMFDQHETEDCPKQAASSSPEPTRHHGDPKSQRPYCEICEAFGHWTTQCDDEQTY